MTNSYEPIQDATASSAALKKRILSVLDAHGGWMSFADYMEQVLYAPGWGYYSGGSAKLGREGDFVTAPEMTPLYGRTLARALQPLLEQTGPAIVELGAGTGRLARDILVELASLNSPVKEYAILELSGELQERQQKMLSGFSEVKWLSSLPEGFEGVVIANEVLDAMPVQLVVKRGKHWQELGVTGTDGQFVWCERPCGKGLAEAVAKWVPEAALLPDGYITEIHTRAFAFVKTLSEKLSSGQGAAALFVDYGFPAREYYHPDRRNGTLMCHFRHHAHDDPFFLPGLQDVTTHINFTAMAKAAEEGGMELLCYTSQSRFLIGAGLPQLLKETAGENGRFSSSQSQPVQTLLSPAEMGELFKVLVIGYRIKPPAFLLETDRSGRL